MFHVKQRSAVLTYVSRETLVRYGTIFRVPRGRGGFPVCAVQAGRDRRISPPRQGVVGNCCGTGSKNRRGHPEGEAGSSDCQLWLTPSGRLLGIRSRSRRPVDSRRAANPVSLPRSFPQGQPRHVQTARHRPERPLRSSDHGNATAIPSTSTRSRRSPSPTSEASRTVTRSQAVAEAADCLEETWMPGTSPGMARGRPAAVPGAVLAAKAALYEALREQRLSNIRGGHGRPNDKICLFHDCKLVNLVLQR